MQEIFHHSQLCRHCKVHLIPCVQDNGPGSDLMHIQDFLSRWYLLLHTGETPQVVFTATNNWFSTFKDFKWFHLKFTHGPFVILVFNVQWWKVIKYINAWLWGNCTYIFLHYDTFGFTESKICLLLKNELLSSIVCHREAAYANSQWCTEQRI